MKLKAYAEGDIDRIKQRYGAPDIEWCSDDPPVEGKYDLVVLDHFLQSGTIDQAHLVLVHYSKLVKEGGRLILIVPSLEWCATQIATSDVWPISVYIGLYGTLDYPHRCGFTLYGLRRMCEQIPWLHLVSAISEAYVVNHANNSEIAYQNVVTCIRRTPDAAEAIE